MVGGFLGFLLGAVVGGALMVVRRAGRKSKSPLRALHAGRCLAGHPLGRARSGAPTSVLSPERRTPFTIY